MEEMTALQFLVALFMSLAGLCVFAWAVLSGQFVGIEDAKHQAYRKEVGEHEQ